MGPTVTGAGEVVGGRRIERRAPGAVGEREGAARGHIPHLDPGPVLARGLVAMRTEGTETAGVRGTENETGRGRGRGRGKESVTVRGRETERENGKR